MEDFSLLLRKLDGQVLLQHRKYKIRIIRNLKKFIVNIIKVIAINANSVVTKVTLNSSIIVVNIFSTDFARKVGAIALWNPFFIDDSGAVFHAD